MSSDWLEVQISTSTALAEECEAWLFAAGALSVTLRDSVDDDDLTHAVLEPLPGEQRLWDEVSLTGLFAQGSDADGVRDSLSLSAVQLGLTVPDYVIQLLPDQAWERTWLQNYHSMQFGQRFWICPTESDVVDPMAINLRLDPGLAFGTGTHATTALCLMWMGEQTERSLKPLAGKTVIDYGCGSGVLAIASLLLGAEHAWAVDIDEQALVATDQNAKINGVQDQLSIGLPDLVESVRCDVVFANILFQPLLSLASTLSQCTRTGGDLIISGILEEQIEPLRMRYNSAFEFTQKRITDGWAMLSARRHST